MKQKFTLMILFSVMTITMTARDYNVYYQNSPCKLTEVFVPNIPDYRVSLIRFGGKGDGVTLNTDAFQKAIQELSSHGGGHLDVPAGIYLTGFIKLKADVDIHLDRNATILMTNNKKLMMESLNDKKAQPGISGENLKNISITGQGHIDGNGEWWRPMKHSNVSNVEWNALLSQGGEVDTKNGVWFAYNLKHEENIRKNKEQEESLRNNLIKLTNCENVLIEGVTVMNSPRFHIVPIHCKNVIIDNVTVRCPWNATNGDGIDVTSSQNILIVNSTIDVGDDGICMKSGIGEIGVNNGPCENINIQGNTVYNAHGGFVIGSDCSGGFKNILVRNNTFAGTDRGLRFKSAMDRGGKTENIFIDNIYMSDIQNEAIVFETTYANHHVGGNKPISNPNNNKYMPEFTDIHINHIVCRGAKTAISAHGEKGMIYGIHIDNSTFFYADKSLDIDKNSDIKLTNVNFKTYEK